MLVTDKNLAMETKLIEKLDLCIDRCTKKHMDNLWIIDGDEGFGKSTFSVCCAYYVAFKSGRKFSVDNVFFDIKKMIDFAKSTKDQIIIWDEAALGGLSTEWRSKFQIELTKLLMVARKKRHFYFFNIPKFFKLNEYMLIDRSIAMVHVYARNELELGRFCYFKKKSKEKLWYDRIKTRQRLYKQHYDFHGTFPNKLAELIDEDAYEKMKDEAIEKIGTDDDTNTWKIKMEDMERKMFKEIPKEWLLKIFPDATFYRKKKKFAKEITSHSQLPGL